MVCSANLLSVSTYSSTSSAKSKPISSSSSSAVSKPPSLPIVDMLVAGLAIAGAALACLFSANTFFLSNNGERPPADKDVGGVAIFGRGGGGGIASLLSTSSAVFVSSSVCVSAVVFSFFCFSNSSSALVFAAFALSNSPS